MTRAPTLARGRHAPTGGTVAGVVPDAPGPVPSGADGDPADLDADADAAALRRHADALAGAIEVAIGPWVERCVHDVVARADPGAWPALQPAAARAAATATAEVGPRVRALLALDVDRQPVGPLELLRSAVVHPTSVLAEAGVPPVPRDEFALRAFPADVYDLVPASFADVDPSLQEPGITWGAAKAHVVLARRRAEGRR